MEQQRKDHDALQLVVQDPKTCARVIIIKHTCVSFMCTAVWLEKYCFFLSHCPAPVQGLPAPTLFSLVEILPLALFSLVAMASFQPLQALNKNSARLATFAVRSCRGRVASYTFTKKSTGAKVTQWKFETWLVGTKPEE